MELEMTKESVDVVIARIDERLNTNIELTSELLAIIKGEHGLVTRMAIIEKHPETCPLGTTIKWHTWAIRSIFALPVIGYLLKVFVDKGAQ